MKLIFAVAAVALPLSIAGCGGQGNQTVVASNVNVPAAPANSDPKPPAAAPVTDEINILFILDSSGSMKANIQGRTKMDIAKEVVNQLASELPKDVKAGLLVYGHRQKDDCKDTELVIPVGPVDTGDFSQKVNALQPIGQTPISFSLTEAAAVLKDKKGKKTVILVSDGEETCKQDPCDVAKELKAADIDLRTHVIGFGIDKASAKKQLSCIAEATGGVYKDAGSATELKDVLKGLAEASQHASERLVVDHLDSYGKRVLWCVEVFPEGKSDIPSRVFEACGTDTATENAFEIKPGRYDVWVYGTNVGSKAGKQTVEIVAGRETRIALEQSGRLFLNIIDQNGAAVRYVASASPVSDTIRAGGAFYSGERQELMPGVYDISMWGGPVGIPKKTGVVIKSGEETKIDITIDR